MSKLNEGLFITMLKRILESLEDRGLALPRIHALIFRVEERRLKIMRRWGKIGGKPI